MLTCHAPQQQRRDDVLFNHCLGTRRTVRPFPVQGKLNGGNANGGDMQIQFSLLYPLTDISNLSPSFRRPGGRRPGGRQTAGPLAGARGAAVGG